MTNVVNIDPSTSFLLGDWLVEPGNGRIRCGGADLKLEPKVMEVLVYLAQHPGTVVSHETLEVEVWSGMIVGYGSVPATIIKLRKALGDNSRKPRYIETVSKRGYRLIAPVAPANGVAPAVDEASVVARPRTRLVTLWLRQRMIVVALGLIVLLAALVVALNRAPVSGRDTSDLPSILVLPFKSLGDDPGEAHLSEGITDDLITDLSRIDSLRVIARQTSYYYKDGRVRPDEIFRQLNVSYIVEGSVRKSGRHIRVNVQLSNARKGESIWGDRIDTDTETLFDAQDRLVQNVIQEMYSTLSTRGSVPQVSRGTRSFDAYNAFLVGQRYAQNRSRQGYEQSIKAYERAISIDPNYARVYGAMAVAIARGYRYGWNDLSAVEARERALNLARKAAEMDQLTPQIYWSLGYVYLHRHEYDAAEKAARKSIALSPSYADGLALLANVANWRGRPGDAIASVNRAIKLNPFHSFQYPSTLGAAYYHLGRYPEAVAVLKKAVEQSPTALTPHLYLAASYTQLGLGEEAAWEMNEINVAHPDTRISELTEILPYEHRRDIDTIARDLLRAGMVE